jgi:hypothetical protein
LLARPFSRIVYTERVGGSNPSPPTSLRSCELRLGKPELAARRQTISAAETFKPLLAAPAFRLKPVRTGVDRVGGRRRGLRRTSPPFANPMPVKIRGGTRACSQSASPAAKISGLRSCPIQARLRPSRKSPSHIETSGHRISHASFMSSG